MFQNVLSLSIVAQNLAPKSQDIIGDCYHVSDCVAFIKNQHLWMNLTIILGSRTQED